MTEIEIKQLERLAAWQQRRAELAEEVCESLQKYVGYLESLLVESSQDDNS